MFAVCKAVIWQMSDDINEGTRSEVITDYGARQQGECHEPAEHEPAEQPKPFDWSGVCCRDLRLGRRLRPARDTRQVELRAGRDHRAVLLPPTPIVAAHTRTSPLTLLTHH